MRIAAVGDLHGHLPAVPPCDLLLVAGDIAPPNVGSAAAAQSWLTGPFRAWLNEAPACHTIGIAGNHDFLFQQDPDRIPAGLSWTYLQDSGCTASGLSIWGSPWTPWFHDWAFNAPRLSGEGFLDEQYAAVPLSVDVLLLHGPPTGYGDTASTGVRAGSTAALRLIDRVSPLLCVFGHIHAGRGTWRRAGTTLINCSAVNDKYELLPEPFVLLDL